MSDQQTTGGVLLELPRDQAKAFFKCRDESSVAEFLQTQLANESSNRIEFAAADWQLLAAVFGDEPPLAWCFTAGRAMPAAEGATVNLLRPDMVGHIATRLGEIVAEGASDWIATRISESGSDATDDQVASAIASLSAIQTFCDTAAKQGSAAVFATT